MGWVYPLANLGMEWSHLDTNWYIKDGMLPCTGFAYRIDFEDDIYIIGGTGGYVNFWIKWIVWIETPEIASLPKGEAILRSPFVQEVKLNLTIITWNMFYTWYFSSEVISDKPVSAGFTAQTPPFKYTTFYGTAETGILSNGGGSGYGIGSSGNPDGMIIDRWQSPAYSLDIPTGSRFRFVSHTASMPALIAPAVLTVNTFRGPVGISIAKDRERRLYKTSPTAISFQGKTNNQIKLERANKDTEEFNVTKTVTTGATDKSAPNVMVNKSGDVTVAYVDGSNIKSKTSKSGGNLWS